MLKIKAPKIVSLSRAEERELVNTLRKITITSLYKRGLVIVPFATAFLLALVRPSKLAHYDFGTLFIMFLSLAFASLIFSKIFSIPLYVKAALRGCPTFYFWTANAAMLSLISATIVALLSSPETGAGSLAAFAANLVNKLIILSGATYIILEVQRDQIQSTFASFGLKLDTKSLAWQTPAPQQAPQNQINDSLRNIRAIQVEDKYLKIYTDRGVHQLTQSLSAATENLDQSLGMRVHRSVWLSWQEMAQITYENGNPRMIGQSGQIWPVSRNKVPEIKGGMAKFKSPYADAIKLAAQ